MASTLPAPDVPERRASARASAGGITSPMVEIDPAGHTVYVGGDWGSLADAVPGPDALAAVLERSGHETEVMAAIDAALRRGDAANIAILLDAMPRWVKVVPIPAPNRAEQTNVLIGIAAEPDPPASDTPEASRPVPARPRADGPARRSTSRRRPRRARVKRLRRPPSAPSEAHTTAREVMPHPATSTPEPGPAQGSRLEAARQWVESRGVSITDLAIAAGIVLLALLLRVWDLEGVPTGFHGDEAITGQEAQRVIDQGSIGIYTGSALGQATGPFYLYAVSVWLFGPAVWSTRLVAALAGVLTVAVVYVVVRRRFDTRIAAASALALATMTWSIHFSRIAFAVAWWPLVALMAVAAIDRATRSGEPKWWFGAGLISAAGIYVYTPHAIFGLAVALFMMVWLFWPHRRSVDRRPRTLVWGPIGALVGLLPLINYLRTPNNGYFNHFDSINRRDGAEWTEAGLFGKAEVLIRWYVSAWNRLLFEPLLDPGDASGIIEQVPLVFVVLAAVGVFEVLRRHRTAFTGMLLVTVAVLPLGPSMTFGGITRRQYAMAPLLAILAGIGAIALADLARRYVSARAGPAALAGLGVIVFATSVVPYFTTFRDDPAQTWVFSEELTDTIDVIRDVQDDGPVFVNWYSGRHYFDYPTLVYLLDDVPAVDRAPVHEGYNENAPIDRQPGVERDQLYVLIGDYDNLIERLEQRYPQGEIIVAPDDPSLVSAYLVPAD